MRTISSRVYVYGVGEGGCINPLLANFGSSRQQEYRDRATNKPVENPPRWVGTGPRNSITAKLLPSEDVGSSIHYCKHSVSKIDRTQRDIFLRTSDPSTFQGRRGTTVHESVGVIETEWNGTFQPPCLQVQRGRKESRKSEFWRWKTYSRMSLFFMLSIILWQKDDVVDLAFEK